MYKKYYSRFLEANSGTQHFACHSHHYWPDVTREAHLQYWDDAAKYVDDKWEYFFSNKIPDTQKLISKNLNISNHKQIVFAPNTHEFVTRILSCFNLNEELNILTTDSEFYSFDRQINRVGELKNVKIDKVATLPFDNFEERFIEKLKKNKYNLVFLSQVFFNSGLCIKNFESLLSFVPENTFFVIDGYHGFMAVPTNLSKISHRTFYLAGSYKYAQGGEGCCFMVVPTYQKFRPLNTGWFAGLHELSQMSSEVHYPTNAMQFAGSTMDFSSLYRLNAVLNLFESENITVEKIHSHIQFIQKKFLNILSKQDHPAICEKNIIAQDYNTHGHFFSFALSSEKTAQSIMQQLKSSKIVTDLRGSRLRFGFGLYHDENIDLSPLDKITKF